MDASMIGGALSSLKAAGEILKSLYSAKVDSDVRAAVSDLREAFYNAQAAVIDAQAEQSAMIKRIDDLEEELVRFENWETEKQRYKLYQPWPGSIVYAIKESQRGSEPAHWICTSCYEDRRKSILTPKPDADRYIGYFCAKCKAHVPSPWRNAAEPAAAPDCIKFAKRSVTTRQVRRDLMSPTVPLATPNSSAMTE